MFRVWLLCLFLLLGSCAYFNELEQKSCESKDWNSQATKMALDGKKYSTTKLNECETRGARIDRQSFENAYGDALKRFCTAEYGEYFGREGGKYQQTCPPSLENGFLAGYSRGKGGNGTTCTSSSDCTIKAVCVGSICR